jgi:hypothetical protein
MWEAEQVGVQLGRNKRRSHGFGRRRLMSGRTFGSDGRRYVLDVHKGAHCTGNDKVIPESARCGCPSIGVKALEDTVSEFCFKIAHSPAFTEDAIARLEADIAESTSEVEDRRREYGAQLKDLEKRRERLSIQHEASLITSEQMQDRLRIIEAQGGELQQRLQRLGAHESTTADEIEAAGGAVTALNAELIRLGGDGVTDELGTHNERFDFWDKIFDQIDFKVIIDKDATFNISARWPLARYLESYERSVGTAVRPDGMVPTTC